MRANRGSRRNLERRPPQGLSGQVEKATYMETEQSNDEETETDADTGLERWIRQGDHDKELVADPDTRLEKAFTCMGCLGWFALPTGCQVGLEEGREIGGPMMGIGVALGCLGFYLRGKLDDHYRIDFEKRTVTFYRKFFSKVTRRPVCDFSRLHCLAIDGEARSTKNKPTWWEYGLILVLKDGTVIRLTDVDEKEFSHAKERAQVLSVMLETPLHPPEEKITYEVKPGPGGPTLQAKENRVSALGWVGIIAFLGFLMALLFLK